MNSTHLGINPFAGKSGTDGQSTLYQSEWVQQQIAMLSGRAQRLFLHILARIKSDYIELQPEDYLQINGITSRTTFKNARNEMVRAGFITPTGFRAMYWVNPEICSAQKPQI